MLELFLSATPYSPLSFLHPLLVFLFCLMLFRFSFLFAWKLEKSMKSDVESVNSSSQCSSGNSATSNTSINRNVRTTSSSNGSIQQQQTKCSHVSNSTTTSTSSELTMPAGQQFKTNIFIQGPTNNPFCALITNGGTN